MPGETFNLTYGTSDAQVSGVGLSTTVTIENLSVEDYILGVATKNGYADTSMDGIMGLGFKGLNRSKTTVKYRLLSIFTDSSTVRPTQQPTVMMVLQDYLQQPVFTLNLKADASGEIEFGLVDHSKHKGNLVEAKVNNITDPYWTVDAMTLSSGKAQVTQRMIFGASHHRAKSQEALVM